eukprot:1728255-Rhodomonas_salina.2
MVPELPVRQEEGGRQWPTSGPHTPDLLSTAPTCRVWMTRGKSGSSYLSGIKNFFAGSSAKTGPQSPASSLQSELGRAWPAHIRDADPAQRWRKILEYEVARKKGGAAAAADKAAQQVKCFPVGRTWHRSLLRVVT